MHFFYLNSHKWIQDFCFPYLYLRYYILSYIIEIQLTQTCFKICWGGGAGSPGVKEMFGETKHMEQLMDHSLWNIYICIY